MVDKRFYKKNKETSLSALLEHVGCAYKPKGEDITIHGLGSLQGAEKGDISVCFQKKSLEALKKTKASACLVTENLLSEIPAHITPVVVDNPRVIFAKIAAYFYPNAAALSLKKGTPKVGKSVQIHETAFIGENVEIGEGTIIGSGAHIGDGVVIGKNCTIYDNVTLIKAIVGQGTIIKPGARVGLHGFGFELYQGALVDIPHLGRVVIGNNVSVGANTCIDRGVIEDTIIGDHVRIDNLVQIAHNVKLGKGCIIVSQVGISGSTEIGDGSILAGQAGLTGHLKIGKNVKIAAQSGVLRDIDDGQTVGGSPAVPIKEWHRQTLFLAKQVKKKF